MIAKKHKNTEGFTFAEVLVAVLILVMITAGLMPAAMRAYQNAVDASNAHALLTETVNTLRSELSTAWDLTVSEDGKKITYKSAGTGSESIISLNGNAIEIQKYTELPASTASKPRWFTSEQVAPSPNPLISEAMKKQTGAGNNPMSVKFEKAILNEDGFITIENIEVGRTTNPIVKIDNLVIRTLGGEKTP